MNNSLSYKAEFEKLLSKYSPNIEYINLLPLVRVALLVAPAATGRNTIIRELVKTGEYHYIISDTTRNIRINDGVIERDGVEYWFKSEEQALQDLSDGNYLGPAIIHGQQFSGINIKEIKKAYQDNKIAITDVEIQGSEDIVRYKNDCVNIFVLPPNFDEWMRRLSDRGTMEGAEKKRRLTSATNEIEQALANDTYSFFVNDALGSTVQTINNFIMNQKNDNNSAQIRLHARSLLRELYAHPFWHS